MARKTALVAIATVVVARGQTVERGGVFSLPPEQAAALVAAGMAAPAPVKGGPA